MYICVKTLFVVLYYKWKRCSKKKYDAWMYARILLILYRNYYLLQFLFLFLPNVLCTLYMFRN